MKLKKLLLGLISIVMLCSGIICMSFVSQNISMNHPEKGGPATISRMLIPLYFFRKPRACRMKILRNTAEALLHI